MPAEPDARARLGAQEHQRIFLEEILPDLAATQHPQQQPLAVLLGGQPGIGKSSTKQAIVEALAPHGGVVDFSADLLRPYHPRFDELLTGDERDLAELDAAIDQDARGWVDLMIGHARDHQLNAVVDSNLANPDRARGFIDQFREASYRVEVQFVAGSAALSRLGVLQRYQSQVDALGHGAYCATTIQARNYTGVFDTARMLDREVAVDRVVVSRRGGTVLHTQDRIDDGQQMWWHPSPGAAGAIESERSRPWTSAERSWWLDSATTMAGRLAPDYLPDLHAAGALARPLIEPSSPDGRRLDQLLESVDQRMALAISTDQHPQVAPTAESHNDEIAREPAGHHNYHDDVEGYDTDYDDLSYGYDD